MEPNGTFSRDDMRARMASLARQGVWLGTSSWKYPGWRGMLYDEARYVYRGRFSESRFNRLCLSEYAGVFRTVGVDAAYYQYPTQRLLLEWKESVPEDFLFSLKVTDSITLKRYPNLPRFGVRAGRLNPDFLDAGKFCDLFLGPLEEAGMKDRVGVLMLEFTRFHPADFARGRDFVEALGGFLAKLPKGWRYGVELRNSNFLHPLYFETLSSHGACHVFNSWEGMPPIGEQMSHEGAVSCPEFAAVRLLLKPGRKYADAVARFSPYQELKEPCPEVREAAVGLIQGVLGSGKPRRLFVYVNNRLEGNALQTLQAIAGSVTSSGT